MVAAHGGFGGVSVAMIGAWAKTHEGRQAVAEGDGVGEEAGGATVSVGEGVYPHPFGVRPSTSVEHGIELVGGEIGSRAISASRR